MNCKILLTLLFVSAGLCGMDAPPMQLARSCQTSSSKRTSEMADESDDYAKRLRRHRGENTFICPECVKQCDSVTTLHSHIIVKHTQYRPYECKNCKYKAAVFSNLVGHIKVVHKQTTPPTIALETQKKIAEALSPFLRKMDWHVSCFECDLLFPSFQSLEIHQSRHKKELCSDKNAKKIPVAPTQPGSPALKVAAQDLVTSYIHAETGPVQETTLQGASGTDSDKAQKPVERKRHACPECVNVYNRIPSLHSHILITHIKALPYECTYCEFKTTALKLLTSHMNRIHKQTVPSAITAETQKKVAALLTPFLKKMGWDAVCSECDLLFPTPSSLTMHQNAHYKQLRTVENKGEIITAPDYLSSSSRTLVDKGSTFDLLDGENQLDQEIEIDFSLLPQTLEGADSLKPADSTHDGTDDHLDYSLLALTPLPGTPAAAHAIPNGIKDKIGTTQQPSPHGDQLPEVEFDSEILADKEEKEPLLEPIVEKDTTQELSVPQLTSMTSPDYRGAFSCPEPGCSYTDQSAELFKQHILKKHIPFRPYGCAVPECTFKSTNILHMLNTHIRKVHHSSNNISAPAETSKKITQHLNEILKKLGWEHTCKTCEGLFPTQISLQNHTNKGHKRRGEA